MITWKHAKPFHKRPCKRIQMRWALGMLPYSNRLGSLGSIATSAPYLGGVGPLD